MLLENVTKEKDDGVENAGKAITTFIEIRSLVEFGQEMAEESTQSDEVVRKLVFMNHLVRKGEIDDKEEVRKIEKALTAVGKINHLTQKKKDSLHSELQYINENLPKELDKEIIERLGLAWNIWTTEIIVSNIAEFGLDGILYLLIHNTDIPIEVKSAFGGIITASLSNIILPLPIPSTAGVTRTFMHIFSTPYFINRFNRKKGNPSNMRPNFRPDYLALMFEGMGITLLPFLTLLRSFGLDLSFGAVNFILKLKYIKEVEEMYDLRQL